MILQPQPHELDRAFESARDGDTIMLREGRYQTAGNWAAGPDRGFCQLAAGVCLRGVGPGTVIELREPKRKANGVRRVDRDLSVLWADAGVEISDLVIDAREQDFRENEEWYVGGLRFHGRFELQRVTIRNLRGAWKPAGTQSLAVEVFALSSVGDTGGSLVDDVCVCGIPDSSYVSGIYLGSTLPATGRSLVFNCRVDLGKDNQFAFSANRDTTFMACVAAGGRHGFYNDTGPTQDVRLVDCTLAGDHAAVSLIAKDPTGIRTGFRVQGGRLSGGRGLEVWDHTQSGVAANVAVCGAEIDATYVATVANRGAVVSVMDCALARPLALYRTHESSPVIVAGNRLTSGLEASPMETIV